MCKLCRVITYVAYSHNELSIYCPACIIYVLPSQSYCECILGIHFRYTDFQQQSKIVFAKLLPIYKENMALAPLFSDSYGGHLEIKNCPQ